MSFSNGYDIEFDFSKTNFRGEGVSADFETLGDHLNKVVENYNSTDSLFKLLCDEAQLPNVQSATGQLQGRYLGENPGIISLREVLHRPDTGVDV